MSTLQEESATSFEDSDVFALDNIRLELAYAGLGSRVMAGLIDYALFYGLTLVLTLGTVAVLAVIGGGFFEGLGGWVVAIALLLFFLFESFWFAGQEILMGGQTLGKRALSLRTLSAQGHSASKAALLLRNLIKVVDVVVGGWFLAFDKRSRRLGDRLGGTVVVHESVDLGGGALRRVPQGWKADKIKVVEELLDRVFALDDSVARSLSDAVLDVVERDDPQFLEGIPRGLNPVTRLATAFGTGRAAPDQAPSGESAPAP